MNSQPLLALHRKNLAEIDPKSFGVRCKVSDASNISVGSEISQHGKHLQRMCRPHGSNDPQRRHPTPRRVWARGLTFSPELYIFSFQGHKAECSGFRPISTTKIFSPQRMNENNLSLTHDPSSTYGDSAHSLMHGLGVGDLRTC